MEPKVEAPDRARDARPGDLARLGDGRQADHLQPALERLCRKRAGLLEVSAEQLGLALDAHVNRSGGRLHGDAAYARRAAGRADRAARRADRSGQPASRRQHGRHRPAAASARLIDFDDFMKVDIRVGRVVRVEDFPEARKPAWKLFIDFGPEIGEKRSSAQIKNYTREELEGTLVMAVVNFPPRQIGPFMSEVLTLGVPDEDGRVILLRPTADVPVGGRMF